MTSYETRNGREVKDGGGILPDIIIDPGQYSMIVPSLLKERLFFDYATDYRFSHDSISEEFIFSDADFSDFSSYISDKEYTYKTETEKSFNPLVRGLCCEPLTINEFALPISSNFEYSLCNCLYLSIVV